MSTELRQIHFGGVLMPHQSISLAYPKGERSLQEELNTPRPIDFPHTASGVWETLRSRLGEGSEGYAPEIVPYEVGLSAHQPRKDPHKKYIRAPGAHKPSHYEILSYLGQSAFVPWRTLFALVDADGASNGEIFSTHGPTVGLYIKTNTGGIMKVILMRSEVQGSYIYYMDNPIVPDAIRAGPLEYGTKTIFALARPYG